MIENKMVEPLRAHQTILKKASKHSLLTFKDEVVIWASDVKHLKSGQVKVITASINAKMCNITAITS